MSECNHLLWFKPIWVVFFFTKSPSLLTRCLHKGIENNYLHSVLPPILMSIHLTDNFSYQSRKLQLGDYDNTETATFNILLLGLIPEKFTQIYNSSVIKDSLINHVKCINRLIDYPHTLKVLLIFTRQESSPAGFASLLVSNKGENSLIFF